MDHFVIVIFCCTVIIATVCGIAKSKNSRRPSTNKNDCLYDSILSENKKNKNNAEKTPAPAYVSPPDPDEVIDGLFMADDRAGYFHDEVEPLIERGDITADDLRDYRTSGPHYNVDGLRLYIDWNTPRVKGCDNTPSEWPDTDSPDRADYFLRLVGQDKEAAASRFFKKHLEDVDADAYDHKSLFSDYLQDRIAAGGAGLPYIYFYDFNGFEVLIKDGEVLDCGFDIDIPDPDYGSDYSCD